MNRVFLLLALLALLIEISLAAAPPKLSADHVEELHERAVPAACASPKVVSVAYGFLSVFRATPFCTKWLGIKTKTVSSEKSCSPKPPVH